MTVWHKLYSYATKSVAHLVNRWIVLAFLAISINVYINLHPKMLVNTMRYLRGNAPLTVGRSVPVISARSVNGAPVDLKLAGASKPTIVYWFSPRCVWCARNTESLDALVRAVKARYQIIGMSNTNVGLLDYVRTRNIEYPVYSTVNASLSRQGTPTTYLVSAEGIVEAVWVGAWLPKTQEAIEKRFGVLLPAISAPVGQPSLLTSP